MPLADTHCHLDFHAFNGDRSQVIERAREAEINRILDPGTDLESSRAAVKLAGDTPEVFAAVGVHPNDSVTWGDGTRAALSELASQPGSKVAAIGEIGLDYYRDRAPRDWQQHVLKEQLSLAAELGLPVVIHNRQAGVDTLSILSEWCRDLAVHGSPLALRPGVLHSFSENEAIARQALELNFFIGITGPVTFKNAPELQALVAALPLESLLVETDAPFLTPHPHRGQRNEPAYVSLVAAKIAAIKNLPVSAVAEQTWANSQKLFNW